MSLNGLSFASARPTPQPCVSVHRCRVFEKLHFLEIIMFYCYTKTSSCILLLNGEILAAPSLISAALALYCKVLAFQLYTK